jgi:hypothetical protein
MGYQSISLVSIRYELWSMAKKGSKLSGLLFLIFGLMVTGVSAYVYQQATLTVTQNILEITTFTVKNSSLGNINEGETRVYTSAEVANLGDAISVTITTVPVYLHFDSDIDSLSGSYSTYDINIIYDTAPPGGSGAGTACVLSLASPDYSTVTLDTAGTWIFDLSIETTADSVDADTPTTITLIVGAESS